MRVVTAKRDAAAASAFMFYLLLAGTPKRAELAERFNCQGMGAAWPWRGSVLVWISEKQEAWSRTTPRRSLDPVSFQLLLPAEEPVRFLPRCLCSAGYGRPRADFRPGLRRFCRYQPDGSPPWRPAPASW